MPISLDITNLTSADVEDIEEYYGKPGVYGLLMRLGELTEASGEHSENGDGSGEAGEIDVQRLLSEMPAKIIHAIIGVQRRREDPSFTPDKWREINLFELAERAEQQPEGEAPSVPPTTAATRPSGKRTRAGSGRNASSAGDASSR